MAKLKHFSGSPVAEGVRMEVGKYTVFAVRNADKNISVRMRREPRNLIRACMRIPFLRGAVRMVRDVVRFFDGMSESYELKPQRVVRGNAFDQNLARLLSVHPQFIVAFFNTISVLLIAFACLFAAPLGAEALLQDTTNLTRAAINGIVCGVRIISFLLGIGLTCRLKMFKRMMMYRCAINKVTNCYECRDELTLENAAKYPRYARRSEAAFLIGVMIISMVLFSFVRSGNPLIFIPVRIGILLGVAAVLNEPFSALETAYLNWATRIARLPIDLIQHMTTAEPHPQILEVALCAFQAALGQLDSAASDED